LLRLDQLFFRNLITLFFITLLICLSASYFVLKKIELNNFESTLKNMIEVFELSTKDIKNFDSLAKKTYKNTGIRVTIIDINGIVLAESNKDKSKMENHINRAEIIGAKKEKFGTTIRYSHTLKSDFMYVAKLIDTKKEKLFVRMALSTEKIMHDFYTLWIQITLVFALSMIIGFFISHKINKNITKDVKKIKSNLNALINKDYQAKENHINVTEFKTISNQIEQVSKKLQKRERQKTKYTKKLKILTKKQSDIISAISHEFKNPVAAIIGYANTLEDDKDINPALREKFLSKITNNAYKITNMIDRLSMAVKLENENLKPIFSTFDFQKLLYDVKDTLQQKYKNREIIIKVKSINITADKTMMENLFINLIDNALKYSDDEVVVALEDKTIKIIDQGIGISEEELENITKKFYTIEKLSWDNSIGIGLYIVKYILKIHNIELKIKSKPGVGSEFSFDILGN